jgi:hypothetical protein
MTMTKAEIEKLAAERVFLDTKTKEFTSHADLDATHARQFLESKGFEVVENFDTGYNGWAITKCGIWLSTNGYICKKNYKGA